jgi:formyl-CoA transferase
MAEAKAQREPISRDPGRLKVLDLGTVVAAPFAAAMLGDLGAEVIKVEQPGGGDMLRSVEGYSPRWQVEGRNKRSVTLNLRAPEGQELLKKLALWADVLIENFRPGAMAKWGLSYAELAKVNPRLVYVSISGFGQTGPYAPRSGYDFIGAAMGGLTHMTGYPDRPPVAPGIVTTDYTTGLFGVIGALEAVRRRDAPGSDGRGAHVDCALYESALRFAGSEISEYSLTGLIRERIGGMPVTNGKSRETPIFFSYRTRDGRWISLAPVSTPQVLELRALIDDPQFNDPKFATSPGAMNNGPEFYEIVSRWVGARDFAEVWRLLGTTTVPCGAINNAKDLFEDPHIQARGAIVTTENAKGETVAMPAPVPRFGPEPAPVRWAGELLGASNHDVYAGLLGLSESDIEGLHARGVI